MGSSFCIRGHDTAIHAVQATVHYRMVYILRKQSQCCTKAGISSDLFSDTFVFDSIQIGQKC